MLLAAFVGTATNIAVPLLEEEFADSGLATVSWVVSAFNVAQVTFMLLGGRLADRVGRKRIFLRGLLIFGLGAAASGLVPTVELVIASRAVQAVGVALMIPSSLAAVLPEFPPERHGSVVSLWSTMGVFGAAVAPTVAAGLLQIADWRWVFLSVLPIVAVAAVVGTRVLSPGEPADDPAPLDLVGAATGTAAIGGLTFVIVQGRLWGWFDPRVVVIAALALMGGAWFLRSSARHDEPLLDLGLLRIPTFSSVTLAGSLLSSSTSATWFLYPLFLIEVWEYSVFQVGLAMTPGPLILVAVMPLAGRLVDRRGFRRPMIFGATLATFGTAWMAWWLGPDGRYVTAFLPGTLSIGLGMAFTLGPANAAALRDVPQTQLGAANAAFNMSRMTGAALGVAVTAAIIGDTAVGQRLHAFRTSWWVFVAVMSLGPVLLWLRYPADGTSAEVPSAEPMQVPMPRPATEQETR